MVTLSRRSFIQTSCTTALAGASGALAFPLSTNAKAPLSSEQASGFYRYKVGDFEITTLSDGYFELPTDSMATNAKPAERKDYLRSHFISEEQFRLQASPLLINTGEKLILVDSGIGEGAEWAPGAGRLSQSLGAADIDPEMIDLSS